MKSHNLYRQKGKKSSYVRLKERVLNTNPENSMSTVRDINKLPIKGPV